MIFDNRDAVVQSVVRWAVEIALQHSAVRGSAPVIP